MEWRQTRREQNGKGWNIKQHSIEYIKTHFPSPEEELHTLQKSTAVDCKNSREGIWKEHTHWKHPHLG